MSCLGPYAKYSCCLYPSGNETLEAAEVLMLESYCKKAKLKDGLDILDLGCGMHFFKVFWGILKISRMGELVVILGPGLFSASLIVRLL